MAKQLLVVDDDPGGDLLHTLAPELLEVTVLRALTSRRWS